MPRSARKKSSTGINHIILRGINRQDIFCDEEDNEKFIQTLSDSKKTGGFKILGYCLMGNHVHLLMEEDSEGLEIIFRRIGARYVYWYNWKYQRIGHLFQDRFKSEPVENDEYLMTALRYIHRNPIKAGLCVKPEDYYWSSYIDYIGLRRGGATDIDFIMNITGKDELVRYTNQIGEDIVLEIEDHLIRKTDPELVTLIGERYDIQPMMIQNEPKHKREYLLKEILKIEGVSTRQLARITGVSASVIWKL